jgi:hypothetical protein
MAGARGLPTMFGALCWRAVIGGVACAVLVSAGCQAEEAAVSLPKQPGQAGAAGAPSSGTAESESNAVRSAYREFVTALERADSLPDADRKQHLSQYMVDPQLAHVLKAVEQHKADQVTTYGSVIVQINSVQVDKSEAVLRDCQDARYAGLRSTRTGKKINRGIEKRHVQATLKKGPDRRWRVSKHILLGEGC